ncbi:unnamed protein product [Ranitomeya imitator]|uniref:Reverse transcriptase domain-containing protein n=1 Tax=Ranitomeya imitator TaxID=111125 RepID=A0ABN9L0A8_9NEOB|nr:unnamed protein product [Ranitomeya imitator]
MMPQFMLKNYTCLLADGLSVHFIAYPSSIKQGDIYSIHQIHFLKHTKNRIQTSHPSLHHPDHSSPLHDIVSHQPVTDYPASNLSIIGIHSRSSLHIPTQLQWTNASAALRFDCGAVMHIIELRLSECRNRYLVFSLGRDAIRYFRFQESFTSSETCHLNLARDFGFVDYFYRQIFCNIYHTLISYVDREVIDEKTRDYLTKTNSITPVFYILPKVHKNLEHPPGRPIVASTESILSPLAIFLKKILTPIIRKIHSFLFDTGDFLHELQKLESIPGDSMLVSLDVKDLYTSIPHSRGISSVRHLVINSQVNSDIIDLCLDLLTLVLTKNFMFEDRFFLQTKGTAMGSNVAPPYANSYMALFEEKVIYTDPLFQAYCPIWKWYIDDVFCIWTGTFDTHSISSSTISIQHGLV